MQELGLEIHMYNVDYIIILHFSISEINYVDSTCMQNLLEDINKILYYNKIEYSLALLSTYDKFLTFGLHISSHI